VPAGTAVFETDPAVVSELVEDRQDAFVRQLAGPRFVAARAVGDLDVTDLRDLRADRRDEVALERWRGRRRTAAAGGGTNLRGSARALGRRPDQELGVSMRLSGSISAVAPIDSSACAA